MLQMDLLYENKGWYIESNKEVDIAILRQKYQQVVSMRDNAWENTFHKIIKFVESKGATNWFSTPYERWQNRLAESAINSVMRLASIWWWSLGSWGYFGSRQQQPELMLITLCSSISMDVLWTEKHFTAFGCSAFVHLNQEQIKKGMHNARALDVVYLGFELNTSAWSFFIQER